LEALVSELIIARHIARVRDVAEGPLDTRQATAAVAEGAHAR